jgi:hypothetical protein
MLQSVGLQRILVNAIAGVVGIIARLSIKLLNHIIVNSVAEYIVRNGRYRAANLYEDVNELLNAYS